MDETVNGLDMVIAHKTGVLYRVEGSSDCEWTSRVSSTPAHYLPFSCQRGYDAMMRRLGVHKTRADTKLPRVGLAVGSDPLGRIGGSQ